MASSRRGSSDERSVAAPRRRNARQSADARLSLELRPPADLDNDICAPPATAKFTGETDSLAEGTGFELSVPCRLDGRFRDGLIRRLHHSRSAGGAPPSPERDRRFESRSLQQTVRVSRDFALPRREAGLFPRPCGVGEAARSTETGVARDMAPTGGNISVGPYSSTAVLPMWFATVPVLARKRGPVASGRNDIGEL